MISVGTSIRATSLRKSSYHVGTKARLAVADALAGTFQLGCTACSLMRLPRTTSILKEFLKNSVKNAYRPATIASLIPSEQRTFRCGKRELSRGPQAAQY